MRRREGIRYNSRRRLSQSHRWHNLRHRYTSITGCLQTRVRDRILLHRLRKASTAPPFPRTLRHICARTIKTRQRNAKRREAIRRPRHLATKPNHRPSSLNHPYESRNHLLATSEGGGICHGRAVMDLRRGRTRDRQWVERAVGNFVRSLVGMVTGVDARTGKRGNRRPARREMNPKCGYEGADVKLANLATRLDRR